MPTPRPTTQSLWREQLAALPDHPARIPAFFFGHGSPMLLMSDDAESPRSGFWKSTGPASPLAHFLRDFGPALLEKYSPKAIVIFSAHWETSGETRVTDYPEENPLLFDYYGFQEELYKIIFHSKGDSAIASRVVELLKQAGIRARTTPVTEPRGRDGRGFYGPGLDHGVFVPFKLMFGDELPNVPVIQVSIDSSLTPEANYNLGRALRNLRSEGVLILSGGLTIHTFQDFTAALEETAKPHIRSFHNAILDAAEISEVKARKEALFDLIKAPGFRAAHPREEHFIPIYVAAGAGEQGQVRTISAIYSAPTFAFGV
ncbi:Extradiol aromatic ring-opening dioxygenase [Sistotremastrum niveocremeum HHB9708]|uniref:Extradiol aromatic ring-opening dioxygenase n=1 Tax=Sistotremastrum niveocremeum HHB9708 TaxID=1314777 RepID=A0A165AKP0_9AGAM|nr:Extradiol aromatic ring-opening dioxygenase [Sistotremastrum niveocremeum HHB9708]